MQATRKNDIYSCKLFCVRFEKDGLRTYLKLLDFFRMHLSSTIFVSWIEDLDVK